MAGWRPSTIRRRTEGGASAVEFALILPVFVLIIAAIIDFGFIFAQQVSLNNAARDASRAGVVKPLSGPAMQCQAVVTNARNGVTNTLGIAATNSVAVDVGAPSSVCSAAAGSASVSGTPAGLPCTGANALTVTLSYTSQALVPLPYLNSMVLTAKGVFQCEYS